MSVAIKGGVTKSRSRRSQNSVAGAPYGEGGAGWQGPDIGLTASDFGLRLMAAIIGEAGSARSPNLPS